MALAHRSATCRAPTAAAAPAPRPHAVQLRRGVIAFAGSQPATKLVAGPVTDETWEKEVLQTQGPVLVDFWAPWCGPCRMIAPLIDELASENSGSLKCLKLNTDESPGVATEYGIKSIPTVMLFKDGKKVETIIGAVPKSTMEAAVKKYL